MAIPDRESLRRAALGVFPVPDGDISRMDRIHVLEEWPTLFVNGAISASMTITPTIGAKSEIKPSITGGIEIQPRKP